MSRRNKKVRPYSGVLLVLRSLPARFVARLFRLAKPVSLCVFRRAFALQTVLFFAPDLPAPPRRAISLRSSGASLLHGLSRLPAAALKTRAASRLCASLLPARLRIAAAQLTCGLARSE